MIFLFFLESVSSAVIKTTSCCQIFLESQEKTIYIKKLVFSQLLPTSLQLQSLLSPLYSPFLFLILKKMFCILFSLFHSIRKFLFPYCKLSYKYFSFIMMCSVQHYNLLITIFNFVFIHYPPCISYILYPVFIFKFVFLVYFFYVCGILYISIKFVNKTPSRCN